MTMVGRSHRQVLVPGCNCHQDDARGEGECHIDEYDEDESDDLEDYGPVIIGVSGRGEGKTKSGLSEAFGEKDWRG